MLLNRKLVDLERRQDGRRFLMVEAPVRHGKSEIGSRFFPAWYLGKNPDHRYIQTGADNELAKGFGRFSRDLLVQHGGSTFGVEVSKASRAADRWDIEGHRGGLVAVGVGQPPVGRGGNAIGVDDPIRKSADAYSKARREEIWRWWQFDIRPRLEPNGIILFIMSRWHEDDLAGRLQKRQEQGAYDELPVDSWEILHLPALAEPTEDRPDPLGRERGQALCPERYDADALEELRSGVNGVGPLAFEALYQNNPTIPEGTLFKKHWWKYVTGVPFDTKFLLWIDLAGTEEDAEKAADPDWTAATLLGFYEGRTFIVWSDRVRSEAEDLERWLKYAARHVDRLTNSRVPIVIEQEPGSESKSYMSHIKRNVLRGHAVESKRSTEDKVARSMPLAGQVQAGNVYIVEGDWNETLVEEFRLFPNGTHDDIVDTVVLGFNHWNDDRTSISTYQKKTPRGSRTRSPGARRSGR